MIKVISSQSAAVGIAYYRSTFVNANVGVVLFEHPCLVCVSITGKVAVIHISIVGDKRRIGEVRPAVGGVCAVVIAFGNTIVITVYTRRVVVTQCPGISPVGSPTGLGLRLDFSIS